MIDAVNDSISSDDNLTKHWCVVFSDNATAPSKVLKFVPLCDKSVGEGFGARTAIS
jgi:hypothetical protein